MLKRRFDGLRLLGAFFAFGCLMASLSFLGLLLPGGFLEPIWRLNPRSHAELGALGAWGMALMFAVAIACGAAAVGLWRRARWGLWLGVTLLGVNLVADLLSALLRHDLRTLIGVPIGGALILYLLAASTRVQFGSSPH